MHGGGGMAIRLAASHAHTAGPAASTMGLGNLARMVPAGSALLRPPTADRLPECIVQQHDAAEGPSTCPLTRSQIHSSEREPGSSPEAIASIIRDCAGLSSAILQLRHSTHSS